MHFYFQTCNLSLFTTRSATFVKHIILIEKMYYLVGKKCSLRVYHGKLKRQLGQFVQYDLCLYRPAFHVLDIYNFRHPVHTLLKDVHVPTPS